MPLLPRGPILALDFRRWRLKRWFHHLGESYCPTFHRLNQVAQPSARTRKLNFTRLIVVPKSNQLPRATAICFKTHVMAGSHSLLGSAVFRLNERSDRTCVLMRDHDLVRVNPDYELWLHPVGLKINDPVLLCIRQDVLYAANDF